MRVAILKTASGEIASVYADPDVARAAADRFNTDPFIEPVLPDGDVPYSVEIWEVQP